MFLQDLHASFGQTLFLKKKEQDLFCCKPDNPSIGVRLLSQWHPHGYKAPLEE